MSESPKKAQAIDPTKNKPGAFFFMERFISLEIDTIQKAVLSPMAKFNLMKLEETNRTLVENAGKVFGLTFDETDSRFDKVLKILEAAKKEPETTAKAQEFEKKYGDSLKKLADATRQEKDGSYRAYSAAKKALRKG